MHQSLRKGTKLQGQKFSTLFWMIWATSSAWKTAATTMTRRKRIRLGCASLMTTNWPTHIRLNPHVSASSPKKKTKMKAKPYSSRPNTSSSLAKHWPKPCHATFTLPNRPPKSKSWQALISSLTSASRRSTAFRVTIASGSAPQRMSRGSDAYLSRPSACFQTSC